MFIIKCFATMKTINMKKYEILMKLFKFMLSYGNIYSIYINYVIRIAVKNLFLNAMFLGK